MGSPAFPLQDEGGSNEEGNQANYGNDRRRQEGVARKQGLLAYLYDQNSLRKSN